MVGHGLVDQVTGDVDDVSTFMVDLQGRGGHNCIRTELICNGDGGTDATYHGGEQQSHEDGPRDQEEDDEDADDFIQRSFQPDNDLREGGGDIGVSEVRPEQRSDTWRHLGPDACVCVCVHRCV